MTFGSLFAGIGGFDLGFERAGMDCRWQVEIDNAARGVLERHWPGVQRYRDVRECGAANLEPVDVICGGFPCQDVSVAGRRAGLAGERSGLWFEFHRILGEVKPRWIVIENVPGLLSSNRGRDFAAILRGLADIGYSACWRVLDAQYFGLAQRRRRVFIVASLGDGRCAEVLLEREGGAWDSLPRRETGTGVARSLTGSTGGASAKEQQYTFVVGNGRPLNALAYGGGNTAGSIDLATAFNAHGGSGRMDFESETFITQGYSETGQGYWGGGIAPLRSEGENRPSRPSSVVTLEPVMGFKWHASATARSYGQTVDGSTPITDKQPGVVGSFGVRRLTPTECERLQGFPDGHTAGQSDSQRYRQLGNAVAVPCAEWIGRRIVEAARG